MRSSQSFTVFAGEDVTIPIAITDNAGNPVDLSGASVQFVAARSRYSATLVLDSGAGSATATITDAPGGIVTVTLAHTNTDALLGTYAWELKVTDSSSNEVVTSYGYVTFKPSLLSA